MKLDLDEFELFRKLHTRLMGYANDFLKVHPNPGRKPGIYERLSTAQRIVVHRAFDGKKAKVIDAYLKANPDGYGEEDLAEIRSWKAAVTGEFVFYRQLQKHAIFLDLDDNFKAYGVLGLSQGISEVMKFPLPVRATTTLLPFLGKIVYDGFMGSSPIDFSRGSRAELNAIYIESKREGVAETLVKVRGEGKAKRVPPAERVRELVGVIRERLGELRAKEREVKKFSKDVLGKVERWVEKNYKKEREEAARLHDELDELEDALEWMHGAWEDGEYRTREEAAEAAMEQVKKERERERKAAEAMMGGGKSDEGDDPESEDEDSEDEVGNRDEEMPDFMVDFLFETFMREARGVDVNRMGEREYEEARAQFEKTIEHVKDGNISAFQNGLLETGADRSAENVDAVKKAFRRLAKRLHPDQNPDFGEEAKELWEELGAAKKAYDLEALERLELHWMILQGDEFTARQENRLKDFKLQVDADLFEVRTMFRELEGHPLWGHEGKTIPADFKAQIKRDITEDLLDLKRSKKELEEDIEWFRGKPRRVKPKRRKHQPTAKKKKVTATKKAGKQVPRTEAREVPGQQGGRGQREFDF